MSYRRSRKRRRSQAFPAEEEEEGEIQDVNDTQQNGENGEDNGEMTSGESKKELEIWDAFREEHFEVIEQLPLSLHRQYTLLRELDEQAQGYKNHLLPTIQRYVKLRQSMTKPQPEQLVVDGRAAMSAPPEQALKSEPPPTPTPSHSNPLNDNGSTPSLPGFLFKDQDTPAPVPPKTPHFASLTTTRTPTPMSIPQNRIKQPQTTREMLSHIAWLSEEVVRASEEKVNLAQAAYDSVDRHIRLLDQSIKEQEAAISLGVRPGTHLTPILLPELIVPGSRAARAVHSPAPAPTGEEDGMTTLGMMGDGGGGEEVHPLRRGKAGKKGRGRGRFKKEDTVLVTEAEQAEGRNRSRNRNRSWGTGAVRSLKLNLSVPEEPLLPPPPASEEPRYCYCNQVSFGEMVACDNEDCEREWFHLGCVGLEKPPADDESWYCRDCQHLARGNKRSKTRQRKR